LPVGLSYARSIAPRGGESVVVTCPSPAITRLFVMSVPTLYPVCAVRETLTALERGAPATQSRRDPDWSPGSSWTVA